MKINFTHNKGFTLIELLTVISIIGVLTGLLTVSFLGVRVRGRDAQRKSDIKQIQSALELYRADNDTYPTTSPITSCGAAFSSGATSYMTKVPCDPQSGGAYYYFFSNSTSYVIASCLENTSDKDVETTAPSWWPAGATLPTCDPVAYYISRNP